MILLTGASGFLGGYIYNTLIDRFEIDTISRSGSTFDVDLSFASPQLGKNYDLIIHNAGKAHMVPKTVEERNSFFKINVNGTKNLLIALEQNQTLPQSFIFISTVATYGVDVGENINEETPLKASDPYGRSKIEAEQIILDWCSRNNVICTILRLPLIAGANPPGNLKSLVNGIDKGYYFNIAGGKAQKSIVLAMDVANILPVVSKIGGIYNLTDGYHPTFAELASSIAHQLGRPMPFNMPYSIANFIAKIGDLIGEKSPINTSKLRKMTSNLTFDDSKARKLLLWNPTSVLKSFKV